jgi:DNA repair protein RadA/Sms
VAPASATVRAVPLAQVDDERAPPRLTGNAELDRVLVGGLRPSSVTLVAGEPGIGKSTLLLQVSMAVAASGAVALWASAEEDAARVRSRAERLGELPDSLLVAATSMIEDVEDAVAETDASVLVVDSIQAFRPAGCEAPGGVPAVRQCLDRLMSLAHARRLPVLVVGHVTKDGRLAGPRALEHLVDTVLWLEGDRHAPLRFVRAVKHRHGDTGEVGVLQMGPAGLEPAPDIPGQIVGDRERAPGSVVCPLRFGGRTVMTEIQALVRPRPTARASVRVHGLDTSRVVQVIATLDRQLDGALARRSVFVSTVGGVRSTEPASDLAVAMAVFSALRGAPLGPDLLALGELALTGWLRPVRDVDRRLADARRMGFRVAVVADCPEPESPGPTGDIDIVRVTRLGHALSMAERLQRGSASVATRRRSERPVTSTRGAASPAVPCSRGVRRR